MKSVNDMGREKDKNIWGQNCLQEIHIGNTSAVLNNVSFSVGVSLWAAGCSLP